MSHGTGSNMMRFFPMSLALWFARPNEMNNEFDSIIFVESKVKSKINVSRCDCKQFVDRTFNNNE